MKQTDQNTEDFSVVGFLVGRLLEKEGYQVICGEAQEWAARYTLSKSNLDGNIALFIGPGLKEEGQVVRYKLVSEKTVDGALPVPGLSPEDMASAFVLHLDTVIYRDLQPSHEQILNIGDGLVSVSIPDAQLDTIRSHEQAEESAR